jgi:predicted porin
MKIAHSQDFFIDQGDTMSHLNFTRRNGAMCAAIMLALAGSSAEAQVTLYGILDAGARYSSGLTAANAASNGSTTSVGSGINTTSRFGFRGSEDLGGGLRATFNLESGILVDTGAQANATKLFDRAATVGLQGAFGQVTIGRQTTLLADANSQFDPIRSRFAGFNPNIAIAALSQHRLGIEYGAAGSNAGSFRLDNSIKYSGTFSGITLRAMHSFGEQSGNTSSLSSTGAGASFATGPVSFGGSYQRFVTANNLDLKGYYVGATANLAPHQLSISYAQSTAETTATAETRNKTYGIGGVINLSAANAIVLGVYRVERSRTGQSDDGFDRIIAFWEHNLSKRTTLYIEADHTRWRNGYQGVGAKSSATGFSIGAKHSF